MGSLVLDFLLVIIFLMMIPIGFYRGGLRELSVSAGLLLGIMMADAWASKWGNVYERLFGLGNGGATFLMGVTIAFGITAFIGYGGSSVLSYQPGPGGRLYGAYLALFNAMIVAGFLINLYVENIVTGMDAEAVTTGIVARTLSDGFGSVLLVATIGVAIATVFGMFVRERSADLPGYQPPQSLYQSPPATRPYRVEDSIQPTEIGPPVRIRDVTNWKVDDETSSRPDPSRYGSGWRQTWPDSTPAQQRNTRRASRSTSLDPVPEPTGNTESTKNVLADWIKDQDDN